MVGRHRRDIPIPNGRNLKEEIWVPSKVKFISS